MTVASVVLTNTTRKFDREYHYEIPAQLETAIGPGMRVIVPFGKGNKLREGFVVALSTQTEKEELKTIADVADQYPVLDPHMIKLAEWMKERYICTWSDAIRCLLPPGMGIETVMTVTLVEEDALDEYKGTDAEIIKILRNAGGQCGYDLLKDASGTEAFLSCIRELQKKGVIKLSHSFSQKVKGKNIRAACLAILPEEAAEEIESGRIKKIQQIKVLEILLENEFVSVADLTRFAGVSPAVLNTLRKNGYIDYKEIEVRRDPLKTRSIARSLPFQPTAEQANALREATALLNGYGEILLHGVTGSGKTEVYMQLMQHVIDNGKNAIMLVPEISLTPQAIERLTARFGEEVAVLHSRLSLGERFDQWRLIREGRKKIVVGARSAIFAPLSNIGVIIIDEEHESSYKSETTPRYHAAEIARVRCKDNDSLLVYGSATPSVDTYYRATNGEIRLLELKERANNASMPKVQLIDLRKELENGNRSIFSQVLAEKIEKNIDDQSQTMLFLNRRGHSSFVMCRSCGLALRCKNCSLALTFHSKDNRLICHYCGYTVKTPQKCPRCGSVHIRHFGTGTQKVEEELKKRFPGCSAIRMDMDTTGYKNSHEDILKRFKEENINIMVGTQMIAKGHDFPNVTLVGVLAADSMLYAGDYRASERTFQLLTQVSGRAGRGDKEGTVIIQTYNTEDFSIQAACEHDYEAFYRQEITFRKMLDFPPFTNLGILLLSGIDDRNVFTKASEIRKRIEAFPGSSDFTILGPSRTPIPKIRGKYRWRLVLKCTDMKLLIDCFKQTAEEFYEEKAEKRVDLAMDINPMNML